MDPNIVNLAGWQLIDNTVAKLAVFVVLVIIGAFAMLLSRAIIPSLLLTGELTEQYRVQRQALTVVGIVALALAIFQLVRVIGQVIAILAPYYPRFGF
jgi:hypothetical protein